MQILSPSSTNFLCLISRVSSLLANPPNAPRRRQISFFFNQFYDGSRWIWRSSAATLFFLTTTLTRRSSTLMTPSWNGILFSSTVTMFDTFSQHRCRLSRGPATTHLLCLLKFLSLSWSSIGKGSSIFRHLQMNKVFFLMFFIYFCFKSDLSFNWIKVNSILLLTLITWGSWFLNFLYK